MSKIDPILDAIKFSSDHEQKYRLCEYLINVLKSQRISAADAQAIADFVFAELEKLLTAIPAAPDYKTKDSLMAYENVLLGVLMGAGFNPRNTPDEKQTLIRAVVQAVEKERFFENAVDALFKEETIYPTYVERLLNQHKELTDEYHRGQLYQGLMHYKAQLEKLPEESRQAIAARLVDEVNRYLGGELSETVCNNLEFISDLAKHFPTDAMTDALYAILKLNRSHMGFYALESLLAMGKDVPADAVDALARDLTYAAMTHHVLKTHGKEGLFPAELADEIYLAKSDLVHWLTYPTELGKEPDEIEFLGKTKVKKETFHIFRFQSDSKNLSDDLVGKWLIGWSSDDGGTFSEFDLYEKFEKKTVEKTVKYIRKKLL